MMQIRRATRDDAHADMEQRLNAAYAGDTSAIAALIERSLMMSRMAVDARIEGHCLYLALYGQVEQQQDSLVRFIKSGLQQIQIAGIDELDIKLYQGDPSQTEPVWSYHGQLPSPQPTPNIAIAKSIPASSSPRRVLTGRYSTQWTSNGIRVDATPASPQRWIPQSVSPPDPQDLFDRQSAVYKATGAIKSGTPLQIYGPSGVGKTTLLHHLMQQPEVQQQFGDGIIYVETYKVLSIDILQHLFEALYRSENAVLTKPTVSEIHQALHRRNSLAAVDQIEAADAPDALLDTVPLLLAAPECLLLDQGEVIPLGEFSDHESLTFIERQLGRALAPEEQRSALDLCRQLKGNPALLTQHAALVRRGQSSFAELVQQIDAGFSPETLIMRSAGDLTDMERRLMATLAVFGPVPIHHHHLQAIAGVDEVSLGELQVRGLVWGDESYRLATNLLTPLQQVWDLTPWYERAVHYFCSWATSQHGRIPASGETATPDTLAMLDALWRLLERSVEQQRWSDSLALCRGLDPLLYQYCRWGRWQQVWKLGRQAARELGDRATEAWALHQMGSAALCLDDTFAAQAHLAEAQQLRLQEGDMVGAALAQHNLSIVQQLLAKDTARSDVASAPAAAFVSMSQQLPLKWMLLGGAAAMAGAGTLFGLQAANSSDISVRPRLVNFPPQLLSTTSEPRDIVVRNTSSEAVSIDEILLVNRQGEDDRASEANEDANPNDTGDGGDNNFDIQETCTDRVLLPDATCVIEAQFMPQTVGPHAAEIEIIDDGQTLRSVTLRGVGAVAEAGFRPQSLEFEAITLSEAPVTQTVTVRNEGAVAFTVDTVELVDATAFSIANDDCDGQTLDTRDTCDVVIEFSPQEVGAFSATLTVSNQTRSSIWTLPISGSAQPAPSSAPGAAGAPAPSGPPRLGLPTLRLPPIFSPAPEPAPRSRPRPKAQLSADVEAIEFEATPAGRTKTQRITLTNTGNGDLYFDTIRLKETDDFAIAGTTCGLLKPDESCVVEVAFVPQSAGEYSSELQIDSNIDTPAIPVRGVATAVRRSPPQIQELSLSQNTIEPGETVDLCYDVTSAETVLLRDGQTTRTLDNLAECLPLSPQMTTTYTLVAQSNGEQVEQSVTVTVADTPVDIPDPVSLAPPIPLSPGTPNDVEPISCAASSVVLQWEPTAAPSAYEVRLQREEAVDGTPTWVSVLSQTVDGSQLDVSASLTNFGLHRWQVRSLDAAGNASDASAWQYFLCIVE